MYIAECNSNHDPSQATSDVDLERDESDPLEDSSSFDKLSYISNKELRKNMRIAKHFRLENVGNAKSIKDSMTLIKLRKGQIT